MSTSFDLNLLREFQMVELFLNPPHPYHGPVGLAHFEDDNNTSWLLPTSFLVRPSGSWAFLGTLDVSETSLRRKSSTTTAYL